MTRDDIIRMAREAGFVADVSDDGKPYQNALGKSVPVEWLERFASKVAAAEREECAKVCEAWAQDHAKDAGGCTYESCDFVCAATDCAEAIRARGTQSNEAQDANG